MGKTAFVLSMSRNMAAEHKRGVAIFSLEMSSLQLVNRLICAETELSSERIRNGKLENYEWEQLDRKIKCLVEAPIYIDDTPAISVYELRAKLRRLTSQHKIDIVIIDYLQLMTSGISAENRVQEVSQISRSLKVLARDLDVPIIAISQLSRAVEQRHDKRPILSDLRESGSIEQDADLVLFVYRDEYYNGEESDSQGLAEVHLAKHRNGPTGTVKLSFLKRFAKFADLAA